MAELKFIIPGSDIQNDLISSVIPFFPEIKLDLDGRDNVMYFKAFYRYEQRTVTAVYQIAAEERVTCHFGDCMKRSVDLFKLFVNTSEANHCVILPICRKVHQPLLGIDGFPRYEFND